MQLRSLPAILEEIAALLEIEGENPFRAKAYHNAAKVVAGLDDLDSLIREGRLKTIKGIGETLSANITEYHETGRMAFHEELARKIPPTLLELLQVSNLGPGKIRLLFEKLGALPWESWSTPASRTALSASPTSAPRRRKGS